MVNHNKKEEQKMNNREKLMRLFGIVNGAVCCEAISDEEIDKFMNMPISEVGNVLNSELAETENKTFGGLVDAVLEDLKHLM